MPPAVLPGDDDFMFRTCDPRQVQGAKRISGRITLNSILKDQVFPRLFQFLKEMNFLQLFK